MKIISKIWEDVTNWVVAPESEFWYFIRAFLVMVSILIPVKVGIVWLLHLILKGLNLK